MEAPVAFAELLYDCGVPMHHSDWKGFYPWQLPRTTMEEDNVKFLEYVAGCPRSLKSTCRIAIRKQIEPINRLKHIDELRLPKLLMRYLNHMESYSKFNEKGELIETEGTRKKNKAEMNGFS